MCLLLCKEVLINSNLKYSDQVARVQSKRQKILGLIKGSIKYVNPNMETINPSDNILDFGILMSSNCYFEFHINNLCKKCTCLSGWILRTLTTRDSITMMTLLKSLVLYRLDYGFQLWSPHLVKHIIIIIMHLIHIDQLEKIQRSLTKHISGL